MRRIIWASFVMTLSASALIAAQEDPGGRSPETRAVAFLAKEGPAWHAKFGCYSCHNNGDAVRALVSASKQNMDVAAAITKALNVQRPQDWKPLAAGDLEGVPLARIAFANALVDATEAGLAAKGALTEITKLLVADQKADGSFRVDPAEAGGLGMPLVPGSPASLGTALATTSARRALVAAKLDEYRPAIARADVWIRRAPTVDVVDAAAIVLGLEGATDADGVAQRQRALAAIKSGQHADGGWGADATSQPFHTALALLALSASARVAAPAYAATADLERAIASGRAYLIAQQREDGTWKETVRPGKAASSYAQRVSTTSWATLALFESR